MRKSLFLIGSILSAVSPALARADEASSDSIVVTATREPTPLNEVGQSVSVVTRADIEREQATTATDVLSRLPGVAVTNSGGFGQPASVFIRGAGNAQSLVLIDGVRINDPGDVGGAFDFGALTVGQFDRIEVVRGSSGVLWGSRAIGGVINFITARPTEEWHVNGQAEYGWRDRKQVAASAAGKLGPVGLTLGGNWMKGDGYSAFNEERGATEKDGFESKSANARAEVEIGAGFSADAGGYWTKADYDFDGSGYDAIGNTGQKRDALGYANLRFSGLGDTLSARIGYNLTDSRRVTAYAGWTPYVTNGRVERFEGQVSYAPVEMVSILVGAETEKQDFNDNFGSDDSTRLNSYYGNLTLRPLEHLTLSGGVRYDDHKDYGDNTSFAANGAWVLGDDVDAPVLRASYAEGFRAPSLYQLYYNGTFLPLKAETSKGWDVGVEQPFAQGHGRFSATWFDRTIRNEIDFDTTSYIYYNVDRVRAQGLELGMQVADVNGFDVALSYTYLDAINRDTGLQLPRRAKHNMTASIDKTWAVNSFGGLRLGAELRAGGARWDDESNLYRVEASTVVNLRGSLAVTRNVEIYARLENALNAHYEVVRYYGTPTRSAYAGVRVKM